MQINGKNNAIRLIYTGVAIILMSYVFVPGRIYAAPSHGISVQEHLDNFEDRVEDAHKWGEDQKSNFERALTSQEKEIVASYKEENQKQIDLYLKHKESLEVNNILDERVKILDQGLQKSKIEKNIVVYQNLQPEDLGVADNVYQQNMLDHEKLASFMNKINDKIIHNLSFTRALLTTNVHNTTPIRLEIIVPQGVHALYIGEAQQPELLIEKGARFHIQKITAFNDKGKQRIKVQAKLLSTENILDFQENADGARKWARNYFDSWEEQLKYHEKAVFNAYTEFGPNLNRYLRNKAEIQLANPHLSNAYDTEIELIDKALNKAKMPYDSILYRRVDEKIFNLPQLENLLQGNTIDIEKFNILKRNVENKVFKEFGYMSTSIYKDPPYPVDGVLLADKPILIELLTFKGQHAGYIPLLVDNPYEEVLLPHDSEYKIDDISIVRENNREFVKLKAHVFLKK